MTVLAEKLWWKPTSAMNSPEILAASCSVSWRCWMLFLDQGDSLKTVTFRVAGLHVKMTHDDPRLYLIRHASLAQRGLSIQVGQASVYHMLSPEHRLYRDLPFSFLQLFKLVDMNGTASAASGLPRMPHTKPPTLQEIVGHLNALAADSLPLALALAHAILSNGSWQGLGLLSGSRLSDLILT